MIQDVLRYKRTKDILPNAELLDSGEVSLFDPFCKMFAALKATRWLNKLNDAVNL